MEVSAEKPRRLLLMTLLSVPWLEFIEHSQVISCDNKKSWQTVPVAEAPALPELVGQMQQSRQI